MPDEMMSDTRTSIPCVSTWQIILWWELRRLPYNIAVGITGLVSLVLMELIGASFVAPGEDVEEPMGIILGTLVFGFLANVGYTLGWIAERKMVKGGIEDHRAFRTRFFRLGLSVSCAMATLPAWAALLAWVLHRAAGG
jgi:hypothetical protein